MRTASAAVRAMGPAWLVRGRIETGTLIPHLPEQPPFYMIDTIVAQTPHLSLKGRVVVYALAAQLPRCMI